MHDIYDALSLIKIGKSIGSSVDSDLKGLDEIVNKRIYSGETIAYPWCYKGDSSGQFYLLDKDNILKLNFDISSRGNFENKIGNLVDNLSNLENQMKVIKSYIEYINLRDYELEEIKNFHNPLGNILLSKFFEINKSNKSHEVYWDAFIFSIAKFFLSDKTHDKYKSVFYGPSKKNIVGPAISKKEYDSINKELFNFFDEHGLEKQGYASFLDFLGDMIFTEHDVENISWKHMSKCFNNTFNGMHDDFLNNQKTIGSMYSSMIKLRKHIRYDIKQMSHILEKLVGLSFLFETYESIEMQQSNIDNVKSLESNLSKIDNDLKSARDSMNSFGVKFKDLHNYEVDALYYLISKHDEIQSYGTLDAFLNSVDFRDGMSSDNIRYYKHVKSLFKKISKKKNKGSEIISDIKNLIESEPEYRVHKIKEELLLENISTIKGEIAGIKKGVGSINGSLTKAIEYMKKEKFDTAIFDSDKPDQKLDLSALVDMQEFLKAE